MNGPITWVRGGDVIEALGKDDVLEPHMVSRRCETTTIAFYCVVHRTRLANLFNLTIHLEEHDGPHHVAVACPTHWRYEAPDDGQMRALVGAAA